MAISQPTAILVLILPGASHYDEIAATSNAWRMILPVIKQMLAMEAK